MTCMTTAYGHTLNLLAPLDEPAAWQIGTLAHSLACINRYTGHAARPISVAEHSLLVCDIVEIEMHLGIHAQMAALLHDAHESACNDLSTPAKQAIGPAWDGFETEQERAVRTVYGLHEAYRVFGAAIKRADLIALATEKRDLLPPGGPEWECLRGVQPLNWLNLREQDGMSWQDWRAAFEDRFQTLEFAREHP
jgi:5'-deoxynucleotidase YfbR-like HD superfamily hydrolase